MEGRLGVAYVELKLDKTAFEKQQQKLQDDIKKVGVGIEGSLQKSFQNLGVKTDQIYQLMANKAIASYDRIAKSAERSAAEQFRAQSAMVAKINQLNQEMTRNPLYEQLGIRSVAAINAQKEATILSYETVRKAAQGNAAELIRIERAKNDQLKALDKELLGAREINIASMTRALLRLYAAYYVVSSAVQYFGGETVGASLKMERINSTMNAVTGSATGTAEAMSYVRSESKRLGLDMETAALSFGKFSVAARDTTLEGEPIKKVFTGVSEAVAAMKLPASEAEGIFLALSQMISKGTVSMEELRRQLGDRLPGAFQMAAKAMGVSTAELNKMVSAGKVQAEDLLPKLADELHKTYGKAAVDAADKGQAAINRFNNVMFETKAAIGDVIMTTMIPALNMWAEGVDILTKKWKAFINPTDTDILKKQADALRTQIEGLEKWQKTPLADKSGYAEERIARLRAELSIIEQTLNTDAAGGFNTPGRTPKKSGPSQAEIDAALKHEEEMQKIRDKAVQEELAKFDEITRANSKYLEDQKKDAEKSAEEKGKIYLKSYEDEKKKAEDFYNDLYRQRKSDAEHKAILERKLYTDLRKSQDSYYDAEMELIQRGKEEFEKAKIDKTLIAAWVESQERLALEKTLSATAGFYSEIKGYEDEYRKKKFAWIDEEAKKRAKLFKDDVAAAKWAAQEKGKLEQELFEKKTAQVNTALGQMASTFQAIGAMYDKSSSEYARMQESAKAMIILQNAVAVANAVAAIANQGLGDPYTAFARIAAMAAAMGSLLSSAGLSLGGGGSVSAPAGYQFSDTVLGAAAGTGSESIANTWGLLQDTYDMEYRELSGIYSEMKSLNQNITGLVTSYIRTGGVSLAGINTGYSAGWAESLYNTLNPNIFKGIPILGSVLGWVNDLIGGAVSAIFGGGTTTSITGGGIATSAASIANLLSGGSIGARGYTGVHEHKEGGWFGSDSDSFYNVYSNLNQNVSDMLDKVFQNLSSTIIELAHGLGSDVDAAMTYVFKAAEINLHGKSAEEMNKALSEYFSNIGDQAAEDLFGSILRGYQEVGEGLLETASRLLTDKAVILDTLDMTRQAFTGTIQETIALSEALIALAGDLETLRGYAETYYDKFFLDEEKMVRLQIQLAASMASMNLVLPTTRAGYRAIVESLDLATEAGKAAYVAMLNMAESADSYYSYLEDAQEGAIDSQKEYIKTLKEISQIIDEWLNNLAISDLAPVQSLEEWNRQYTEYKAKASAAGATQENVSDYLNFASKYLEFQKSYGTTGSYQAIYETVRADVEGLKAVKDADMVIQEAQLDALNQIVKNTSSAQYYGRSADEYIKEVNTYLRAIVDISSGSGSFLPGYEEAIRSSLHDLGVPGYASGGDFLGGLRIVGERGPEIEYTGPSRIFSNEQTRSMLSGETTIHNHIYIDGKEIRYVVTKGMRTDPDLIASTRRAVN